eukprot:SAG22_NODE_31_length_27697_cov_7.384376_11_plen_117_part_00
MQSDGCSRLNLTLSSSSDYTRTWRHVSLLSPAGGKSQPHFSGSSCMTAMALAGPQLQLELHAKDAVGVLFEGGAKRFDGDGLWFTAVALTALTLDGNAGSSAGTAAGSSAGRQWPA